MLGTFEEDHHNTERVYKYFFLQSSPSETYGPLLNTDSELIMIQSNPPVLCGPPVKVEA